MNGIALEVEWLPGPELIPQLSLDEALGTHVDTVTVSADLGAVYGWLDACRRAESRGEVFPSTEAALLPSQLAAVLALRDHWGEIERKVAAKFPAAVRKHLRWGSIHITAEQRRGEAYVELGGHVDAPFETEYDEHGIAAVLLGSEVRLAGSPDDMYRLPVDRRPKVPMRRDPDFKPINSAYIRNALNASHFEALAEELEDKGQSGLGDTVALDWLWSLPNEDAEKYVSMLAPVLKKEPTVYDSEIGLPLFDKNPGIMRQLVDCGRFSIPDDALHKATTPEQVRWWAAVGADLEELGGRHQVEPLVHHRDSLPIFAALLDAGASPKSLLNSYGCLGFPLGPDQIAALNRVYPHFLGEREASPPTRSGLQFWLDRQWLELEPAADQDKLATDLERLLDESDSPDEIVEGLLVNAAVAEVYVDDLSIEAYLAAWHR